MTQRQQARQYELTDIHNNSLLAATRGLCTSVYLRYAAASSVDMFLR